LGQNQLWLEYGYSKILIPQLAKETQRFHPKKRRLINRFWCSLLRAL